MSPEQAAGEKDLDGRSDLYALGCVLYEMLAGQPPFTGPTVESIVHQHLTATPPPITQLRPAVPAEVAAALQRALAKTPADRFNPVAQFASALRPATGPVVVMERWPRRPILLAASVVVLAAVGLMLCRTPGTAGRSAPGDRAHHPGDSGPRTRGRPGALARWREHRLRRRPHHRDADLRSPGQRRAPGRADQRHDRQLPLAPLVARRIADRLSIQRRHLRRARARRGTPAGDPHRSGHAPLSHGVGRRRSRDSTGRPMDRGSPGHWDTIARSSP